MYGVIVHSSRNQHEHVYTLLHTLVIILIRRSCMSSLNNNHSSIQFCMHSLWTPVKTQREPFIDTPAYSHACIHEFTPVETQQNSCRLSSIHSCMNSSHTPVWTHWIIISQHTILCALIIHSCKTSTWTHLETPAHAHICIHRALLYKLSIYSNRYSCILSCMHSTFTPVWTYHGLLSKVTMKSWSNSCIHAGMPASFTPAKTQHELLQTFLHTLVYAILMHFCMNSLNNPYSWVQSCMRSSWTPVKAQHELMLTLLYTLMCAVIVHSCRNSAELQLTLFHILMYELITHSFMNSLNNHHSCIQYCMHSSWTLVEAQYELIYKLLHTTMYAFIVHACSNSSWTHVETPADTRVFTHRALLYELIE